MASEGFPEPRRNLIQSSLLSLSGSKDEFSILSNKLGNLLSSRVGNLYVASANFSPTEVNS